MLKRVSVEEVQLGMFIHKLEGSWFKHPFWKARFLLMDAATLESLQVSEVDSVLIDIAKGKDVASHAPRRAQLVAAATPAQPGYHGQAGHAGPANPFAKLGQRGNTERKTRNSAIHEFGKAEQTIQAARKVVSRVFIEARLGKVIRSEEVEPVIDDIYSSIQRNPHALSGLLRCKSDTEYIYRHSLAVCALMVSLAAKMKLERDEIHEAGMVGLLMDIGASRLPVDMSDHDGDYRSLDLGIRKQHVALGCGLLEAAGGIPETVVQACLEHHERFDGSGYPAGIKGLEIGKLARMAALCDEYDNLATCSRSENTRDPAAAIEGLQAMAEAFDPEILASFLECTGIYPIGSLVRLEADFFALVVDQSKTEPKLPLVRTFFSTRDGCMVPGQTLRLDKKNDGGITGIARLEGLGLPTPAKLREAILKDMRRQAE